ncbi:MAG: type II toxin-antitoxin system RelE/ParE family toxin [Mucilaginibacter sp.]
MSREIRWSSRAIIEWVEILEYWKERNKSTAYGDKLDHLLQASFAIISQWPEIGKSTDVPLVRIKILRDYLIYYRIESGFIDILAIWDSRRNPQKFKL